MTIQDLADKLKEIDAVSIEIERRDSYRVVIYGRADGAPDYAEKSKEGRGNGRTMKAAIEKAVLAYTAK